MPSIGASRDAMSSIGQLPNVLNSLGNYSEDYQNSILRTIGALANIPGVQNRKLASGLLVRNIDVYWCLALCIVD